MNVLIWFKRDLRLSDHPALTLAAQMGRVLPLFIVEPDYWRQTDSSARHLAFLTESLAELRDALAAVGAPLIVRTGDAVEVLERLCRQHHIARIISHEETAGRWSRARNARVRAWAQGAAIDWRELAQTARPNDACAQSRADDLEPLPVPVFSSVPGVEPGLLPTAKALKLPEDRCPHRQAGGRGQAEMLLDGFLAHRAEAYRGAQTFAFGAERASSRLSPHLTFGTLSLREVLAATKARQAERPGGGWTPSLAAFQRKLAARDEGVQERGEEPEADWQCRPLGAEALCTRSQDVARLAAWEHGETGLPFLDACMRALAATGWLSEKLRRMVITVASCQLWLDWRATGPILARRFTDYDPSVFWPQIQRASGGIGFAPQIFNPVRIGFDQDPSGAFTRFWLPELAQVPDTFLQEPWKWPGFRRLAGRRYPEPIIDPVASERAARLALGPLRSKVVPPTAVSRPLRARVAPARDGVAQLSFDL